MNPTPLLALLALPDVFGLVPLSSGPDVRGTPWLFVFDSGLDAPTMERVLDVASELVLHLEHVIGAVPNVHAQVISMSSWHTTGKPRVPSRSGFQALIDNVRQLDQQAVSPTAHDLPWLLSRAANTVRFGVQGAVHVVNVVLFRTDAVPVSLAACASEVHEVMNSFRYADEITLVANIVDWGLGEPLAVQPLSEHQIQSDPRFFIGSVLNLSDTNRPEALQEFIQTSVTRTIELSTVLESLKLNTSLVQFDLNFFRSPNDHSRPKKQHPFVKSIVVASAIIFIFLLLLLIMIMFINCHDWIDSERDVDALDRMNNFNNDVEPASPSAASPTPPENVAVVAEEAPRSDHSVHSERVHLLTSAASIQSLHVFEESYI